MTPPRIVFAPAAGVLKIPALVALFLVGALAGSVSAQVESGADDGEAPSGRKAWFVVAGFPKGAGNRVKVLGGGKVSELTLSRREPSTPVRIPADGILRLVRPLALPNEDGEPAFETLGRAVIPKETRRALVILVPAPKGDAPLLYRTKVQDFADFNGGDYLFLNLTTADIAVKMGRNELGLKPGQTRIFEAPALDGPVNMPISYHYRDPEREEWALLSSSTVVVQPTRREICVFSWNEDNRTFDYHGITVPVSP